MDEREAMRLWVRTWKEAGPELEAIRRREVREADNRSLPPRRGSGMVEMQKWFARLPR